MLLDERSNVVPDFNVSDEDDDLNPVAQITAAIRKQEVKKTERLAWNTLTDPVGYIVGDFIQKAGCDSDAMKRLICVLLEQKKYNTEILNELTPMLKIENIHPLVFMLNSYKFHLIRNVKQTDPKRAEKIRKIEAVMARTAGVIMTWLTKVKVSSQAKELYSAICDDNTNPMKLDSILKKRLEIQSQKLQHQYSDDWTYPIPTICPVYNYMSPCKDVKCSMLHVCALCGKTGHIATDTICPKQQTLPAWFIKRLTKVNDYYSSKSRRSNRYGRRGNNGNSNNYNKYSNNDRHDRHDTPPNTQSRNRD